MCSFKLTLCLFSTYTDNMMGTSGITFMRRFPSLCFIIRMGMPIYNTSHPLLERLVGQLEVEAPCPYNSIPYDYRMSQMWVEGTLEIVPDLAPKIMLNEEGEKHHPLRQH